MKLPLEQQYMLPVPHGQYHAWWCSGAFGSQGISRHYRELDTDEIVALYHMVVSLLFRKLSKIILQKYTMPQITFMVRISSWNFVSVHVKIFILKFS